MAAKCGLAARSNRPPGPLRLPRRMPTTQRTHTSRWPAQSPNVPPITSSRALPPALPAEVIIRHASVGPMCLYAGLPEGEAAKARPLILIHSINAAASAAEVRPLFEHYRTRRPTYALDLPGYGLSDRSPRVYDARLMTDAVHAFTEAVQQRHGPEPVDALAVSLSAEYLARAAYEAPGAYGSIALVSPTGFDRTQPFDGPALSSRGSERVHRFISKPRLARWLYRQLTRPGVIRYFLKRSWGSDQIDEELFEYCIRTTQEPGAEHAPLYFLSVVLFSADISTIYRALAMPVWMVHGVRGDFTDFRYKSALADRSNWTFEVMQTGALPYFELPQEFCRGYEAFLSTVGHGAKATF